MKLLENEGQYPGMIRKFIHDIKYLYSIRNIREFHGRIDNDTLQRKIDTVRIITLTGRLATTAAAYNPYNIDVKKPGWRVGNIYETN